MSRYLCERCGGMGTQEEGLYNYKTKKYDSKAGVCDDCEGSGYLGVVGELIRPQEHLYQAKEALACARTLNDELLSDREFLETMATIDSLVDHPNALEDAGTCGQCATQICHAEAARLLLAEGDILDGVKKWTNLATILWQATKYYKLYQEEKEAGRNPSVAFEERGWEM